MRWNEAFRRILLEIEDRADALYGLLREVDRPVVVPYRGYGTTGRVWVRGRVIDQMMIRPGVPEASVMANVRDTWLRFASNEVPGARVRIEVAGAVAEEVTDSEGYFDLEIDLVPNHVDPGWLPYEVTLLEPEPSPEDEVARGKILIPDAEALFGVISDVDDTVIETGATSRYRMLRTLVTGNAGTRLPFEGVAALFETLRNHGGEHLNPVFYVSSGPWNLYEFLEEFFSLRGLPFGPILLQDYGIDEKKLIHSDHEEHKLTEIARILGTYPELRWILVGDSGQMDPEIYAAVAQSFPHLVLGIIVRDVTSEDRDAIVRKELASLDDHGIPYALVQTVDEARSFVQAECLPMVERTGVVE